MGVLKGCACALVTRDVRSIGDGKRQPRTLETARSKRGGPALRGFPSTLVDSGGRAFELHLGRSWRTHDDVDVRVLRDDAPRLRQMLAGWDIKIAASGVLSSWNGSAPSAVEGHNNLWCRKAPGQPWCIDVTIGDGNRQFWRFRRDQEGTDPVGDRCPAKPIGSPLPRSRATAPLQEQGHQTKGRTRRHRSAPPPHDRSTRSAPPLPARESPLSYAVDRTTRTNAERGRT